MTDAVQVVAGFSLINRWLLYASVMLAPAQFMSGVGSLCPSSIGFLAYNFYTQITWYLAVRRRQLHALSMLLPHFNLVYAFTYLGGVSSGTLWVGVPVGVGTAALLILNTISAWKSWAYCMPEGYGVYQFFFFGWRTLTPKWHKFFTLWQVTDSMLAAGSVMVAIGIPFKLASRADDNGKPPWWFTSAVIVPGAAVALVAEFPLILWTELIVKRNKIDSPTDWVAVWLFIAQVGAMLLPGIGDGALLGFKASRRAWSGRSTKKDEDSATELKDASKV